MKRVFQFIAILAAVSLLSGCVALAAGAAGGYLFNKHYDVNVSKKTENT